jgi:hypothetical protein
VETASERQKLMFRVRAQIAPELLQKHIEQVKTGLPGVAWLKLDPQCSGPPWPSRAGVRYEPRRSAQPGAVVRLRGVRLALRRGHRPGWHRPGHSRRRMVG